jgi:L-ascorbate metabolism protein UlaG (beta-lactamase superfamily)
MVITWHGEGCFKFQNGEISLLTDPPSEDSGILAPRFKTDVLLKTLTSWPNAKEEYNSDAVIIGAGEYDVKGIKIKGAELAGESSPKFFKTVYSIIWDQISIGILGHVSGELPPNIMADFEELDILIGPVGGEPFISQEKIAKLVKQLNPKIFIPSFYKIPGLKRKSRDIKNFTDEFNGEVQKNQEKFVFKKKDLAEIKKTKVVCLAV